MDKITPYVLSDFMLQLEPKDLHNWIIVLGDGMIDEYFWKKFCIRRKIVFGPLPWKKRAELWMQSKPVWISLDNTPWYPSSQSPKKIWGYTESAVIEYKQHLPSDQIYAKHLETAINESLEYEEGLFMSTCVGYIHTFVTDNIVYFVLYSPYDKLRIGFYDGEYMINETTHYWGETKNGLRQGNGVMLFSNGFTINSHWYDSTLVDTYIDMVVTPSISSKMVKDLENIVQRYIQWSDIAYPKN